MKDYKYEMLTPFKWFVLQNFPFIDTDFDAITNYQLFCKLGEKINMLIDSQNNLGGEMETISTAFNGLVDYVNHYFDDLDIQTEVDNKLDDMAESGELAEIISEYLNSNAVFCFDNVADMKSATNFVNGSFAKTYGFYSRNDGGGAFYKIRTITNEDVVNESNIIAITDDDTLVAELMTDDVVNVKQFGCKGDNSTNVTAQFQIASNYAETNGLKFYVPEGKYLLNTVTLNNIREIEIQGFIQMTDNTQQFRVYENARATGGNNRANIYINTINIGKLVMKGLNSSMITIQEADHMLLLADDSEGGHDFIAYNIFKLGFIRDLELKDEGTGTNWINENLFLGGRFLSLKIDGNYNHQDNIFLNPQCEGTNIQILRGDRNKLINARLEGNNISITFGENTDGNVVITNFYQTLSGGLSPHRFVDFSVTDNSGNNSVIRNDFMEEHLAHSLNKFNCPSSYTIENGKIKLVDNSNVYETDVISIENIDSDFCLFFNTTEKNLVFKIEAFDENGDRITTNPNLLKNSPNLAWSSNGYLNSGYERNTYWAIIDHTKTDVVKGIKIKIYKPSNVVTSYIENVDLYLTNYGRIANIGYLIQGLKHNITE